MFTANEYGWEAARSAYRKRRSLFSAKENSSYFALPNACCYVKAKLGKWFLVILFLTSV